MKFVFWWAIKYNGYTVMMVYLQCVLPLLFLFIISSFLRKRLYILQRLFFHGFQGPANKSCTCATCHGGFSNCPGHYGYLTLALPVYNVGYLSTILDILKCICKVVEWYNSFVCNSASINDIDASNFRQCTGWVAFGKIMAQLYGCISFGLGWGGLSLGVY